MPREDSNALRFKPTARGVLHQVPGGTGHALLRSQRREPAQGRVGLQIFFAFAAPSPSAPGRGLSWSLSRVVSDLERGSRAVMGSSETDPPSALERPHAGAFSHNALVLATIPSTDQVVLPPSRKYSSKRVVFEMVTKLAGDA